MKRQSLKRKIQKVIWIGIVMSVFITIPSFAGTQGQAGILQTPTESADAVVISENNAIYEKIIGYWIVDVEKTNNSNNCSLRSYFGSGIKYGNRMILKKDGTASWYIGIGNGGEGTYIFSNSDGELKYLSYEDDTEQIIPLSIIEESGVTYIAMKDDYILYWVKSEENLMD